MDTRLYDHHTQCLVDCITGWEFPAFFLNGKMNFPLPAYLFVAVGRIDLGALPVHQCPDDQGSCFTVYSDS